MFAAFNPTNAFFKFSKNGFEAIRTQDPSGEYRIDTKRRGFPRPREQCTGGEKLAENADTSNMDVLSRPGILPTLTLVAYILFLLGEHKATYLFISRLQA